MEAGNIFQWLSSKFLGSYICKSFTWIIGRNDPEILIENNNPGFIRAGKHLQNSFTCIVIAVSHITRANFCLSAGTHFAPIRLISMPV